MGGCFQEETNGSITVPTIQGIILSPVVCRLESPRFRRVHKTVSVAVKQPSSHRRLPPLASSAHSSGRFSARLRPGALVGAHPASRGQPRRAVQGGPFRGRPSTHTGMRSHIRTHPADSQRRGGDGGPFELPCAGSARGSREFKQVPGKLLPNLAQWECYLKTNGR